MVWINIIGLLAVGLLLIWVELLLLPGTTLVGLMGLIIWSVGQLLAFAYLGMGVGLWCLTGSVIVGVGGLIYGLKVSTWRRLSLKKCHEASVQRSREVADKQVVLGARGRCRSTLRPVGKVAFGKHIVEARTESDYLPEDTEVEIIRITSQAIYVQPIQ